MCATYRRSLTFFVPLLQMANISLKKVEITNLGVNSIRDLLPPSYLLRREDTRR